MECMRSATQEAFPGGQQNTIREREKEPFTLSKATPACRLNVESCTARVGVWLPYASTMSLAAQVQDDFEDRDPTLEAFKGL